MQSAAEIHSVRRYVTKSRPMRRPVVAGRTGLEALGPATTVEGDCVKVPRESDDGTKAFERATVAAKRSEISANRRHELFTAFAILLTILDMRRLCSDNVRCSSSKMPRQMGRASELRSRNPEVTKGLATRHHIMLVQAE